MLDGRGLRAEPALALQVPGGTGDDLIAAALAESVSVVADEVLAVIGAGTEIGLGHQRLTGSPGAVTPKGCLPTEGWSEPDRSPVPGGSYP